MKKIGNVSIFEYFTRKSLSRKVLILVNQEGTLDMSMEYPKFEKLVLIVSNPSIKLLRSEL